MIIFVNVIHDDESVESRVFFDIRTFLQFSDELTYEYGFDVTCDAFFKEVEK